ncbi:MAG: integration host factor subunit alpha [Gammaproteobacteria bacterium]|jgi:integration host factor subunit alpha|nr:integration host factor subunit alpha [Gammaproteobacteria bacterium]
MALTKANLMEHLCTKMELDRKQSQKVVEAFFTLINEAVIIEGNVLLSKFGKFITRDKSSRPGRNPKTGEAAEITARRVVVFHAGQVLKQRLSSVLHGDKNE